MPWEKGITANYTFAVSGTLLKPQKLVSHEKSNSFFELRHMPVISHTLCTGRKQGGSWKEATGCKHKHFESFLELERKPHLQV